MGTTTFSGPVRSNNGFEGDIVATDVTATGTVILTTLPTTDPEVEGQLWSDAGVVTVSAGPA